MFPVNVEQFGINSGAKLPAAKPGPCGRSSDAEALS